MLTLVRKNCMEEVAALFGLKLGDVFMIESGTFRTVGTTFSFHKDGLFEYVRYGERYDKYMLEDWSDVLHKLLLGQWAIRKLSNEDVVKKALE